MRSLKNIKGSSAVILALVFTAFAICIAGSITIAREITVSSECEAFGRIWAKAILSEYDQHLLEDYGLMAYFGDENTVNHAIDAYIGYSAADKLDAHFGGTVSELSGYEIGDASNFEKALEKGFAGNSAASVISGKTRHKRSDTSDGSSDPETDSDAAGKTGRTIGNTIVLDTLPSAGMGSSTDAERIAEKLDSIGTSDGIRSAISGAGIEAAFIWQKFGNCVTAPGEDKKSFFRNEWEYILTGKPDDDKNYSSCRKKLFVIRNALNLAALYKDPEKTELIVAAAELITPGPLGAVTQILIAEVWAAMEAEEDLKSLYDNERVPLLKRSDQWKISLDGVLRSDSVRKKLDDASKELMEENSDQLRELGVNTESAGIVTDGLNYDEYLMFMILMLRKETRLLRIMDLVQINMKYRYYRDFDLMEYFTGVRFTIKANGRDHCFEDCYK